MNSTSIRMLHINTERTWRGGEQQTFYLLEGLARRGHHVTLVCRTGSPLYDRARSLPIEALPMRVHGGEIDPVTIVRLARTIRGRAIDIVHMQTTTSETADLAKSRDALAGG